MQVALNETKKKRQPWTRDIEMKERFSKHVLNYWNQVNREPDDVSNWIGRTETAKKRAPWLTGRFFFVCIVHPVLIFNSQGCYHSFIGCSRFFISFLPSKFNLIGSARSVIGVYDLLLFFACETEYPPFLIEGTI